MGIEFPLFQYDMSIILIEASQESQPYDRSRTEQSKQAEQKERSHLNAILHLGLSICPNGTLKTLSKGCFHFVYMKGQRQYLVLSESEASLLYMLVSIDTTGLNEACCISC